MSLIGNDQNIYWHHSATWWEGSQRFLRLLANQVSARFEYFDRIDPKWEGLAVLDLGHAT